MIAPAARRGGLQLPPKPGKCNQDSGFKISDCCVTESGLLSHRPSHARAAIPASSQCPSEWSLACGYAVLPEKRRFAKAASWSTQCKGTGSSGSSCRRLRAIIFSTRPVRPRAHLSFNHPSRLPEVAGPVREPKQPCPEPSIARRDGCSSN